MGILYEKQAVACNKKNKFAMVSINMFYMDISV